MAFSPPHRFGQIIGDMLEEAIKPRLGQVAREQGMYLDWRHPRAARRSPKSGNMLKKVKWKDRQGNSHDLDFVLEAGGSEEIRGRPRAFIEVAYRRYTKHSRNKSQEIQGAVTPLAETFSDCHPFLGAVLAGVFTKGSLDQLRSHGFSVLFFSFEDVVAAFEVVGIDASFDEDSKDADVQRKVDAWGRLSDGDRRRVQEALLRRNIEGVDVFIGELNRTLGRRIKAVKIYTLHGYLHEMTNVPDALAFVSAFDDWQQVQPFVRFEISVFYSNGDEIKASFSMKAEALEFLQTFVPSLS